VTARSGSSVVVDARFNGPPGSGNGGYVCGLVAEAIGPGAAVRLSAPPPLDTPLSRTGEGGVVRLRDGDVTIAEGRAALASVEAPAAPALEAAALAEERYAGRDPARHPFPTCFVCGPLRADGLRIFPGPVDDGGVLACVWRPSAELATDGVLAPRFVWAALDCPSGFACMPPAGPAVLATMTATPEAPVTPERDYVVTAWPISSEGRKHRAGAMLTDEHGARVALAEALWITLAR
jgi:hypothetical protein